jgi:hypothetical protein
MRRQNPPQASLDQAQSIERFLSQAAIASAYALCAAIFFGFISLLFAVLVHDYILNPTPSTIALFAMIGFAPAILTIFACKRRPDDPLSWSIMRLANSRRIPVSVAADPRSFKVPLMNGEIIRVNFSFYYPAKHQTAELSGQLDIYVRAALERECSKHSMLPSEMAIQEAVDVALELIADQFDIPVLYSEIRDVHKLRDAYTVTGDLAPSEYLGTGTQG